MSPAAGVGNYPSGKRIRNPPHCPPSANGPPGMTGLEGSSPRAASGLRWRKMVAIADTLSVRFAPALGVEAKTWSRLGAWRRCCTWLPPAHRVRAARSAGACGFKPDTTRPSLSPNAES